MLLFNYMAGVPLSDVLPECKQFTDEESRPIVHRSQEEIAAHLKERERVQNEHMDHLAAELLGSGGDEEKDAPVFPAFQGRYTPTPPHFPFGGPTPRKARARDFRKVCSPSTPLTPRLPFGEPTAKKLRGEKEGMDEGKDEHKESCGPLRLRF